MFVMLLLLIALVMLLIQTTFLHSLTIFQMKPDFILILTVYIGLISDDLKGSMLGFFLGLLQDSFSGVGIGVNALSKGLIGLTVGYLRKTTLGYNLLTQLFVVFLATLCDGAIVLMMTDLPWRRGDDVQRFFHSLVTVAFYSALAAPFVMGILSKTIGRFQMVK